MTYISYKKRQRYTADQVNRRMEGMGLSTVEPADSEFLPEVVDGAMEELSDGEKYNDIATLVKGEYTPDVLIAWARLAQALKLSVSLTDYSGHKIRMLKPEDERRASALRNLRSRAMTARRDSAITALLADDGIKPEDDD